MAKLLRQHGYSLQAPNKSVEGAQHPDRNAQFEQGEPERVHVHDVHDVHDLPGGAVGKVIPYGVYDVAANDGFRSA